MPGLLFCPDCLAMAFPVLYCHGRKGKPMSRNSSYFKSALNLEVDKRQKSSAWLATVYVGGKRERKRFRTKADAESWIASRRTETEKMGVHLEGLPRAVLQDAVDARAKLEDGETLSDAVGELLVVRDALGSGKALLDTVEEWTAARQELDGRAGLLDAVRFWVKHHPSGASVTVGELVAAYMGARSGKRPSYFKNVKSKCGQFLEYVGASAPVAGIMPDKLGEFMETRGTAPATRNGWRGFLLGLFGLALSKKWIAENPAAALDKVERPESSDDADCYSIEECTKLLRAAETHAPAFAPALALLFFAGIRPQELTGSYKVREDEEDTGTGEVVGGLFWKFVDVDGDVIVTRATSKTKRYRRIPIAANLRKWLAVYGGKRDGRVVPNPQAWRRARERIAAAAGVEWKQDGTRHSFATYHWGMYQDRAGLESAMGHSGDTNTLERFYIARPNKKAAARFWSIMPGGK